MHIITLLGRDQGAYSPKVLRAATHVLSSNPRSPGEPLQWSAEGESHKRNEMLIKRMPWSKDRMDQSSEKPELSPERGFPSRDDKKSYDL